LADWSLVSSLTSWSLLKSLLAPGRREVFMILLAILNEFVLRVSIFSSFLNLNFSWKYVEKNRWNYYFKITIILTTKQII
jgi:hypothetical protein